VIAGGAAVDVPAAIDVEAAVEVDAAIEAEAAVDVEAAIDAAIEAAIEVVVERGEAETPAASRGAPPDTEFTAEATRFPDQTIARRTIFDEAAESAESDAIDDLYNLRELEDDDEGDEAREDGLADVLSLDEEFSRLATESEERVDVVVVARRVSLAELFALRRPLMTHSIAVIAARGADL
jgi:hypothetical protein